MPIALTDILEERQIALQLRSRRKGNALREIVDLCRPTQTIREPDRFLEQVFAREQASSTLAENGVAFPHARTDLVNRIVVAVGRSRAGIPWNEIGDRARLIFVVAVPQQLVTDYLVFVGALARITKDRERRNALLSATTAAEFVETLLNTQSL